MSKGTNEAFEKAYAAVVENGWTNVKHMARQVWDLATLSPAHIEDEQADFERVYLDQVTGRADALRKDDFGHYIDDTALAAWCGWQLRAALSAPPAAGVPIGMACKINGYWEAQLFAGHGCIDRQSLYAHPLPPADVPTGLAHRLLKAYDHGDTGAIEAAIEDIRTMLAAAPTPPASEQQRAVVMPEKQVEYVGDRDHKQWASGANWMLREFLRLNPHLATPPASEQQRAVVMPERKAPFEGADGPPDWRPLKNAEVSGWNACVAEFLRLNPNLQPAAPSQGGEQ